MNDLISREDAINALYHHLPNKTREEVTGLLHEVPSVDDGFTRWAISVAEEYRAKDKRKNGMWMEENTRPRSSQFYCSICHRTAYDPQPTRVKGWVKRCRYAYCPNCGARMDGEENG